MDHWIYQWILLLRTSTTITLSVVAKTKSINDDKDHPKSQEEEPELTITEYDFFSDKEEELNFKKNDKIKIINWNYIWRIGLWL